MFPIIDSDIFQLREMTINDVDDMFNYYSNPEMMKFTNTNVHTSKDETLARIIKLSDSFKNSKGIAWAIEDKVSKEVIGDIGIYYITCIIVLGRNEDDIKYIVSKNSREFIG